MSKKSSHGLLVSCTILSAVLATGQTQPTQPQVPDCSATPWKWELSSAVPGAGPVNDTTKLRQTVLSVALCGTARAIHPALEWIRDNSDRLPVDFEEESLRLLVAKAPKNDPWFAEYEGKQLARLWWTKRSTQEQRRAIYWTAVRDGHAVTWGQELISRDDALYQAAIEGLTEFIPAMGQYSAELDRSHIWPSEFGPPQSKALPVVAHLREGAANGLDGAAVAARRLAAMGDQEFFDAMESDEVFRAVAVGSLRICEGTNTCATLAGIAARQQRLVESAAPELAASVAAKTRGALETPNESSHWLVWFLANTRSWRPAPPHAPKTTMPK
ncbi:MAG: hypothetical protein AB2L07_12950 [Thermoanaerobaculaceae bacterium]